MTEEDQAVEAMKADIAASLERVFAKGPQTPEEAAVVVRDYLAKKSGRVELSALIAGYSVTDIDVSVQHGDRKSRELIATVKARRLWPASSP